MEPKVRTVEERLAELAARAHGVVTREEMLRVGITDAETKRRARKGLLIRQHRGVYRVGHAAPTVNAAYMAAVKACGAGACISGQAAAHLLGLVRAQAPPPEVTAPTERRVPGVRTRRGLRRATEVRGIPVTTVPETLVDLAAELPAGALARACHEAGVKYFTTPRQVDAVVKRRPRAPGLRTLRAVMHGETPVSLSEMERIFYDGLREEGLPLPETNKRVDGRRLDCHWPGLSVELDGYRFHNSRYAWEQDRQREREARKRGEEYRRYTWFDVTEGRREMYADIRALLARLSPGSSPRSGAAPSA
jgi:hypothetical protein